MIDISNQKVNIECSSCNKSLSVTLKQVANQVTISCICGTRIKLEDSNGSAKKALKI
jgi:transcription elongation factor Elf1